MLVSTKKSIVVVENRTILHSLNLYFNFLFAHMKNRIIEEGNTSKYY